jgi:hypothetical protein
MSTRANRSHSLFGYPWPGIPRDYLARRRYFRKISSIVMILLLSVIVAGFIIYNSNPSGFSPPAGR